MAVTQELSFDTEEGVGVLCLPNKVDMEILLRKHTNVILRVAADAPDLSELFADKACSDNCKSGLSVKQFGLLHTEA